MCLCIRVCHECNGALHLKTSPGTSWHCVGPCWVLEIDCWKPVHLMYVDLVWTFEPGPFCILRACLLAHWGLESSTAASLERKIRADQAWLDPWNKEAELSGQFVKCANTWVLIPTCCSSCFDSICPLFLFKFDQKGLEMCVGIRSHVALFFF